jgi:hypothetical protein
LNNIKIFFHFIVISCQNINKPDDLDEDLISKKFKILYEEQAEEDQQLTKHKLGIKFDYCPKRYKKYELSKTFIAMDEQK